ncbi:hypothetical protein D3C81_1982060 [compost metagenome]
METAFDPFIAGSSGLQLLVERPLDGLHGGLGTLADRGHPANRHAGLEAGFHPSVPS